MERMDQNEDEGEQAETSSGTLEEDEDTEISEESSNHSNNHPMDPAPHIETSDLFQNQGNIQLPSIAALINSTYEHHHIYGGHLSTAAAFLTPQALTTAVLWDQWLTYLATTLTPIE